MPLVTESVVGCFTSNTEGDGKRTLVDSINCFEDQKSHGNDEHKQDNQSLPNPGGLSFKAGGLDNASSESSSIGAPNDNDEEEGSSADGEEEVQSTLSLDSLEDALPAKKGLSNFYAGKSKSFGNLADVKDIKDLKKADNPLNKRRSFLAYKLTSSSLSPSKKRKLAKDNNMASISMPLFPVHEQDEDVDGKDDMGKTDQKTMDLQSEANPQSKFYI